MIISFKEIVEKYNMKIDGIIHIGAHYGEEIPSYVDMSVKDIVVFEPLEENFAILEKNVSELDVSIIGHQVALGNENKNISMYLSSNNLESSSILKPKLHLIQHGHITFNKTQEVEMKILDDYKYQKYNFINIDVQGYELEVLRGARKTLNYVDYVYCEVNRDEVYEGNAYIQEIDEFLNHYQMKRVETSWWDDGNWGDALYIRDNNYQQILLHNDFI
jgi:FkbM family methyltransferase